FNELYLIYNKDVFYFLYKLSGYNQAVSEELTQETFYQAFLEITKFRAECDIKTWLFQIAKNRYFMFLRKKQILKLYPLINLLLI
ncbi:MAG: sigma factor, partial [Oscillospiraceae bacterium]